MPKYKPGDTINGRKVKYVGLLGYKMEDGTLIASKRNAESQCRPHWQTRYYKSAGARNGAITQLKAKGFELFEVETDPNTYPGSPFKLCFAQQPRYSSMDEIEWSE